MDKIMQDYLDSAKLFAEKWAGEPLTLRCVGGLDNNVFDFISQAGSHFVVARNTKLHIFIPVKRPTETIKRSLGLEREDPQLYKTGDVLEYKSVDGTRSGTLLWYWWSDLRLDWMCVLEDASGIVHNIVQTHISGKA